MMNSIHSLFVEEPSMMHAIHGQHSYRPDPTQHIITGRELVLLRWRTGAIRLAALVRKPESPVDIGPLLPIRAVTEFVTR
jgi:hypothetical protein